MTKIARAPPRRKFPFEKIQTTHAVALLTMAVANARLTPDDDGDDAHNNFDESQPASEGAERHRRKSTGEE